MPFVSYRENIMDWINNYWFSKDIAQALIKMIALNETDSSKIHDFTLYLKDEL